MQPAVVRQTSDLRGSDLVVANEAARRVQSVWRHSVHGVMMKEYLRASYSQPDIEKARKHAEFFLPKDRHGNLYPLTTPLKSFHSLGCGVALYMYMVHWWSAFFFAASLISFSILVGNLEGNGMDWSWLNSTGVPASLEIYTVHSLGNRLSLNANVGLNETLITALFVWFMFWQGTRLKNLSRRITHLETTAANYTVMVQRMSADTTRETAAEFFARWGEVAHVSIVYNNRGLIRALKQRATRREALRSAHVQWYNAKAGSYPERKKRKASAAVAAAKHRLHRSDRIVAELAAQEYVCTGIVFVTFNTIDDASACIEGLRQPKYFNGSGPLIGAMAPEPEDVIWENLQCSRTEQVLRLVGSSLIVVLTIILSTALVTAAMVLLTRTTVDMYDEDNPAVVSATVLIAIFAVCIVALILGFLLIMAIVPVLAYKFERHRTFAAREMNIVLKLIFFQARRPRPPARRDPSLPPPASPLPAPAPAPPRSPLPPPVGARRCLSPVPPRLAAPPPRRC